MCTCTLEDIYWSIYVLTRLVQCRSLATIWQIYFVSLWQNIFCVTGSFMFSPRGDPGFKMRKGPPYDIPMRVAKGDWNGTFSRNNRKKGLPRIGAWTGTFKEPNEMSMALEPDRRCNFFFSPPAHQYVVTCITEISLIVTLKGHRHDWGQCLFTKIIWHEILIEFSQKVIHNCTNHFGKDWAINRAEITH